jgi:hypothetical protein
MKKLLLFLLSVLPFAAIAQPANPGFEEWVNMPGSFLNRPVGWAWSDGITLDPEQWFHAFPEEDAYAGEYAVTLMAHFDTKDMAIQHTAITGRPEHFKGHYKYTWNTIFAPDSTPVTDIAQIRVFLTRWDADSSYRDTVGFGILDLNASENYAAFDLSLNYLSTEDPDTALISLDPSMLNRIPQVTFSQPDGTSSYFTVDNLSFEGGTLATSELSEHLVDIHPNPVAEALFFGDFTGTVSVRDASGRIFIHR